MKRNESATNSQKPALEAARTAFRNLLDTIFPRQCPICRAWLGLDDSALCSPCHQLVAAERDELYCPGCGRTVGPFGVVDGRCRQCVTERGRLDGIVRVGPYRGRNERLTTLGSLLRRFKFQGQHELGIVLGRWLAQAVRKAPWYDRVEAVVEVPTHWRHRIDRSLYAAGLIAREVARHADLPQARLLRRVRGGPHQIGLSYTARQDNVRGAFALRSGAKLENARLLIIDDVKTTGATLGECAKVLRKDGAAEIYAGVIVQVPWTAPTGQPITSI